MSFAIFLIKDGLMSSQPAELSFRSFKSFSVSDSVTGSKNIESEILTLIYDAGFVFDEGILLAKDVPTFTKND